MKILQVNNRHRCVGGSDIVVDRTVDLLQRRGVKVRTLAFDSRALGQGVQGRLRAFAYSLYSPQGLRTLRTVLEQDRPDLVHVHELYPFFSPWALRACRQAGIPVVMTCHDYRLTCPTAFHQREGQVCELCRNGREYWCAWHNCRGNLPESIAYGLRNFVARKFRLFSDHVTLFIALSEFARQHLIRAGLEAARIVVVPNMVTVPSRPQPAADGGYLAYVGRISPEKGIDTLVAAARKTGLPLRLAGAHDAAAAPLLAAAPANVQFLGLLTAPEIADFYRQARLLVLPSTCFEGFPLVLAEAMSHGLPTLASRIGGLPEIVEDGLTGLLFAPGDAEDLAVKMRFLWDRPDLCRRLGLAGRSKVIRSYSEHHHFRRLIEAYDRALVLKAGSS